MNTKELIKSELIKQGVDFEKEYCQISFDNKCVLHDYATQIKFKRTANLTQGNAFFNHLKNKVENKQERTK